MSSRGVWPMVIAPTVLTRAGPPAAAPAALRRGSRRSRASAPARRRDSAPAGRAPASSTRGRARSSLVGRVACHAQVVALADRPLGAGIPEREVGVGADADRTLAREEAEDARRVLE